MFRTTREKINQEIEGSNNTTEPLDITGIYETFYPTTIEYTFFSNAHKTFFSIDRMPNHKNNPNRCKRTEVMWGVLSKYNRMKLEINSR